MEGPAGDRHRLRDWWRSAARRWPRRLRPRLPRLKLWQWSLVIVLALFAVLWTSTAAQSTSVYSSTVLVTEGRQGLADPSSLFDFGDLPPTGAIEHKLSLKNDGVTDTFIAIGIFGGIRDLIDIEDAFFNLAPGEERDIMVTLTVPATAEPGTRFSGRVVISRLPWWSPL